MLGTLAVLVLGNTAFDISGLGGYAKIEYVDSEVGQIMEFLKCDKLDEDIPVLQLELADLESDPNTTRFALIEKQREIDKKEEVWIKLNCAEILEE